MSSNVRPLPTLALLAFLKSRAAYGLLIFTW